MGISTTGKEALPAAGVDTKHHHDHPLELKSVMICEFLNVGLQRCCQSHEFSRPKLFIWRLWQSAQLRDLVEEAGNHLGMYEPPAEVIWNADGRQITHPDQIVEGATYVVGTGFEPFDGRYD